MKPESTPGVFVFAALNCEAKPLIKHYDLKKLQQSEPFDIYRGESAILVVSGVGKVAMAGAVAYAMAMFRPRHPLMLNFGIAGHRDIAVGSLLLADKVFASDDGAKTYYPQLIGRFPCPSIPLCTLAEPCFEYRGDCLFDMEGAAFYEMAVKFTSNELIHCLKIISDNRHQPAEQINAQAVSDWVGRRVGEIDAIVRRLDGMRRQLDEDEPAQYRELGGSCHFSVSSRARLKALLNRWEVLSGGLSLQPEQQFAGAKQLLKWLEAKIEELDYHL